MPHRPPATHFLFTRAAGGKVEMACGRRGKDEAGWSEFTTMDGIESRLGYTSVPGEVTCRNCLACMRRSGHLK